MLLIQILRKDERDDGCESTCQRDGEQSGMGGDRLPSGLSLDERGRVEGSRRHVGGAHFVLLERSGSDLPLDEPARVLRFDRPQHGAVARFFRSGEEQTANGGCCFRKPGSGHRDLVRRTSVLGLSWICGHRDACVRSLLRPRDGEGSNCGRGGVAFSEGVARDTSTTTPRVRGSAALCLIHF